MPPKKANYGCGKSQLDGHTATFPENSLLPRFGLVIIAPTAKPTHAPWAPKEIVPG
jgi:hypothetical protein